MKAIIGYIALALFMVVFIWGCYKVSKKLSYEWWYKSQVEQTVYEVLEKEGLIVEPVGGE